MPRLENPWKQNPWFESVAVAQRRAKKRLPAPVYGALMAGSERGQTVADNEAAFRELGLAPHVAGNPAGRSLSTRVLSHDVDLPVLIERATWPRNSAALEVSIKSRVDPRNARC